MSIGNHRLPTLPENLWQRDENLRHAREVMERMGEELAVVSFDFFDTIVWRLTSAPAAVFVEVGRQLEARHALREGISGTDYEILRRAAEIEARKKQMASDAKREDISLRDIYENLQAVTPDVAAAAQLEYAAECDLCQLNPNMVAFINYVRQRGLRVVITSDIYLSAAQLAGILQANQFDPSIFEFIFTSSEAGVCKGTGNLFRHVLQRLKIRPQQLLHLGDNHQSDVIGARRAGVRACPVNTGTPETKTIFDRERLLLGAQSPVFNPNSLRTIAAQCFAEDSDESFFARCGALLMGPIMSGFASWACRQYLASGIRKVGAFMREGDLFSQILQREAAANGYELESTPLFVNRKSTALAAFGSLDGEGIVRWLGFRTTLTIRKTLEDLGLGEEEISAAPFPVNERASDREKIIRLAKYLFRPEIAKRIKDRSAEERAKVIDYLRPWMDGAQVFGVCDIGYNGSAQAQLMRILELEGVRTKIVGCYLTTCGGAAERVLKGMDARHYLSAYSRPSYHFGSFIRSPAFLEQAIAAPLGTTLGYERKPDGSVVPILDRVPFSQEMLQCQRALKEGVLLYHSLWQSVCARKPSLLDRTAGISQRLSSDLDASLQPILARVTAFPLTSELKHFGSLPLDDHYYANTTKTLCNEANRKVLRERGYPALLSEAEAHWPQATLAQENPGARSEFFSYAKALLLCNTTGDNDGIAPDLTVCIHSVKNVARLRECIARLSALSDAGQVVEVVVALPRDAKELGAEVHEISRRTPSIKVCDMPYERTEIACLNAIADMSEASFVFFLNEETALSPGWDAALAQTMKASPEIAALVPGGLVKDRGHEAQLLNCLLVRRKYFIAGLGLEEDFGLDAAALNLMFNLKRLGLKIAPFPLAVVAKCASNDPSTVTVEEKAGLRERWPDFAQGPTWLSATCQDPVQNKGVSIIILAHNQLSCTQQCLASIEKHTPQGHELVLVDNGSTDGTDKFFQDYAAKHPHARVILNRQNLGFAAGNNQGLACAQGEDIILLNNDTVVASGWLENMRATLARHPECGLVGPVSNYVSGPQLVSVNYSDLAQMPAFAASWRAAHAHQSVEVPRLVGFCLMMRRAVLEKIGGLDERFGTGNFEDDDFCLRAVMGGFKLRVALDSFVHHTGNQTFKGAKIDYRASMERNWELFKAKWGMPRELTMDQGYRVPEAPPVDFQLQHALPKLAESHSATLADRCWIENATPAVEAKKTPAKPVVIVEAPCSQIGRLLEARDLARKKQWPAAWTATLAALASRPYHPEAYLLLGEIALAAGASDAARRCAKAAREMAPDWAPPRQFLKGNLRGQAKPPWLKLPPALAGGPAPAPPRVSVCLIAKNEEAFLAQCLRSVRSIASQIIVVDTGSTDRTVEIAREFGAEVHVFPWCDDFSAARNAALEHAAGDWILILDADEELLPDKVEVLAREIRAGTVMGYRLPIIDQGREEAGCNYVQRLFRNAPGLYFVGRIHEQVFSTINLRCRQWGLKNTLGQTALLHHGYEAAVVSSRHKMERNLRLLEMAVEEMPGEPTFIMNLGLELVRAGRLEAGLERYWEAFHLISTLPESAVTPEGRETLLTQLSTHLLAAKKHAELVRLWQSPFAQKGGLTASQHFCLGVAHMELKQFDRAAEEMRQCLAKRQRPTLSPVNAEIFKAGPHHCLAMCSWALNDLAGARSAFEAALAAAPTSRAVRLDLARFHASQGRVSEGITLMRQLLKEQPADLPIWNLGGVLALSQPELLRGALAWTAEALEHFPDDPNLLQQRAEALLLNQDAAAALPFWRRVLTANPRRHRGAVVLCEVLSDDCQYAFSPAEEPAISQEVVQWYRQCIRLGAHSLINQLHERIESIRLTLPTFVRVWETAHRQARLAAA